MILWLSVGVTMTVFIWCLVLNLQSTIFLANLCYSLPYLSLNLNLDLSSFNWSTTVLCQLSSPFPPLTEVQQFSASYHDPFSQHFCPISNLLGQDSWYSCSFQYHNYHTRVRDLIFNNILFIYCIVVLAPYCHAHSQGVTIGHHTYPNKCSVFVCRCWACWSTCTTSWA